MKHISIDITIDSFVVLSAYHTNVHCYTRFNFHVLHRLLPWSNGILKFFCNIIFISVCVSIKYLR